MNIKLFILSFGLSLFFISCQVTQKITHATKPQKVENVPYFIAQNYFIKNSFKYSEPVTQKINNLDEFEKYFGKAYYMGEGGSPTKIDFSHEFVLTVLIPETDLETNIKVNKIEKLNNNVKFYYSINQGRKNSFTTRPVLIAILDDKYQQNIEFIKE